MAEENTAQQENNDDNPTMEEILHTIRGMISGDEDENKDKSEETDSNEEAVDEIEELMAEPDNNLEKEPQAESEEDDILELTEEAEDNSEDVLQEIDNAINANQPDTPPEDEENTTEEQAEATNTDNDEASANNVDDFFTAEKEPTPEPESEAEPEPEPQEEASIALDDENAKNNGLISEQSAELSTKALQELINNVPKTGPGFRSGLMLEDLVIEALRPYLKEWLDSNLPDLVQRLVEKEISRILPKNDQ